MKLPIIVIEENTDVHFYQTIEDAQDALEPVDVEDGLYQAYDADGNKLLIKIIMSKIKDPWWLGGGYSLAESVLITECETENKRTEEVTKFLKRYFNAISEEQPEKFPHTGERYTLKEYLNLAQEYGLFNH